MDVGMAVTGRRAAIDAPVQLYEIPNSASAAGARGWQVWARDLKFGEGDSDCSREGDGDCSRAAPVPIC